jgi:probable HAF family extracellular repeat protein
MAWAINANGQVAGDANITGDLTHHAFLYSNTTMLDLGALPGGLQSSGRGINASGQVVGESISANATRAFLYSAGVMTDLGTLGGTNSGAMGVNDSGTVTGGAQTASGASHAFLYSGGNMLDLGTLGGINSYGTAINLGGQVAGLSDTSAGPSHAFLYSNGTMLDLGILPGAIASQGHGINNKGEVTGALDFGGQSLPQAFLYTGGTMYNLNALVVSGLGGMTLTIADDINASGAVCLAFRLDLVGSAFTATPVPTLSGWALMAMAMLMFAGAVWYRRFGG